MFQEGLFHEHLPFGKSKFNLKSDRINLVALAPVLYLPNIRAIQYKLGPERLTRLGNLNVLRLPVICSEGTEGFNYKWFSSNKDSMPEFATLKLKTE